MENIDMLLFTWVYYRAAKLCRLSNRRGERQCETLISLREPGLAGKFPRHLLPRSTKGFPRLSDEIIRRTNGRVVGAARSGYGGFSDRGGSI